MTAGRGAPRVLTLVVGLAIGFAVPTPARATESRPPRVAWSAPFISGPLAIATDRHGVVVTTNSGRVAALDHAGREQWHTQVARDPAAPTIAGDQVVLADDHSVRAVGRADGALHWSREVPDESYLLAAGAGVVVVVGYAGAVRAFDITTGVPAWQVEPPARVFHEPVVDEASGAVLLVVAAAPVWTLQLRDASTGAVRWEHPVDRFTAVPVVSGGRVFVAEGDGAFHAVVIALDLTTGTRVWAAQVPASFESGIVPAVDGRALVVVDHYGTVRAMDAATGRLRWERQLAETVLETRIVLSGQRVVLTTAAMEVVVLDRANGRVVRRVSAPDLDGWAVDVRAAAFTRRPAVLAAVRLGERERVDLWPSP